jgi:hypothetical protein
MRPQEWCLCARWAEMSLSHVGAASSMVGKHRDEIFAQYSMTLAKLLLAQAGRLRTMCGSRTGGWSLPGVMSD